MARRGLDDSHHAVIAAAAAAAVAVLGSADAGALAAQEAADAHPATGAGPSAPCPALHGFITRPCVGPADCCPATTVSLSQGL